MSGTLDRLAALASGTAAVVSVRPRSVFEPVPEVVVPEVVVPEVVVPEAVGLEVAEPAEPVVATPATPAVPEAEPVVTDALEAVTAPATRIPEPVVTDDPKTATAPVRSAPEPVAQPRPAVTRSPPAVPQAGKPARRVAPPVPTAEWVPTAQPVPASDTRAADPAPVPRVPDVAAEELLSEHVLPALIDEHVVAPTAVAAPSPRTDVEVVRVVADPVVEQVVVGGAPQVHVHIGRVEVRPPVAAPEPRPTPAPDLGAYLAARREDRR